MKRLAKVVLVIVTSLLGICGAQGTDLTMSGVVTDSESHKSVAGATVNVVGNRANPSLSDGDGSFILNFGSGTHEGDSVRIRVEKSGYEIFDRLVPVSSAIPLQVRMERLSHGPPKAAVPPAPAPFGANQPKTQEPDPTPTGFQEVHEEYAISLGSVSAVVKLSNLRRGLQKTPFVFGAVTPFELSVTPDDQLAFTFTSWAGVPIKVVGNKVQIDDPLLDRNFSGNAFEIIDSTGLPIFQMIRESANITVNGVFPTGNISKRTGKQVLLWVSPGAGMTWDSERPAAFDLKPIFKYPSWKYPGQNANP
jgi:hypothetical protein